MLGAREWVPPVCLVSSLKNLGADEAKDIMKRHGEYLHTSEEGKRRRYDQLEMEVENILRGEIAAVAEKAWLSKKDDGILDALAARKADPYTLAGDIISAIVK